MSPEEIDVLQSLAKFEILYRRQNKNDPNFSAMDFAGSNMILRGLVIAVGGVEYLLQKAELEKPDELLYRRTDNLAYMINLLSTGQLNSLNSLPAEQAEVIRAMVNDAKTKVMGYFRKNPTLTEKLSQHTCQSFGLEQFVVPLAAQYAGMPGTTSPTKTN